MAARLRRHRRRRDASSRRSTSGSRRPSTAPFNLAEDWPALSSARSASSSDATGHGNAILIVGAARRGCSSPRRSPLARAALRAERVTARSGRTGRIAAAVVAATWILCALVGRPALPGVPFAAADARRRSRGHVGADRREHPGAGGVRARARSRTASPPAGRRPARRPRGQGRGHRVRGELRQGRRRRTRRSRPASIACSSEGGAQLARDGYSAQSAFLTSPTFGGVSWLAHSTLQSGVWVDSQQKYDRLIVGGPVHAHAARSRRPAGARSRSCPRTPSRGRRARRSTATTPCWIPATWAIGVRRSATRACPTSTRGSTSTTRSSPRAHAPVMAEIDFVSSHTPWTPLPRLVPWSEIGDGSVFDPQPAARAGAASRCGPTRERVQDAVRTVGGVHPRRDVLVPAHLRPAGPRPRGARRPPAGADRERSGRGSRRADHDHLEGPGGVRRASPRGGGRPACTRRRTRRCGGWTSSATGSSRRSAAEAQSGVHSVTREPPPSRSHRDR